MVIASFHWVPSAIAAGLTIAMAFEGTRERHKCLACIALFFALCGFAGLMASGELGTQGLSSVNAHSMHVLFSAAVFLSFIWAFARAKLAKARGMKQGHCNEGYVAAILAAMSLFFGALILSGLATPSAAAVGAGAGSQFSAQVPLPETEAAEYNGIVLTPISAQGNNAIKGTQPISRESYSLGVTGLVESPASFSYADLLALPAYSEAAYMPCVEGWGFTAKWTGFRVKDLLARVHPRDDAVYAVFYSADGYSTGLPLSYIDNGSILLAYGINDMTLPAERGFPLQLVARSRYGYKWIKWIDRIELVSEERMGYWESRGYSDSAKVGESPYR